LRSIWLRGGYPEPALMEDPTAAWRWFDAYVRTLSERDLSVMAGNLTPAVAERLLRMVAARHGQTLNVSSIARDLGIVGRTANA
jgi:predicted AAA+ superfamily ATPase